MNAAIEDLQLATAIPNKESHRATAIELVDHAIQQVQEGERHDEQHRGKLRVFRAAGATFWDG
jgi:hypothetical protein